MENIVQVWKESQGHEGTPDLALSTGCGATLRMGPLLNDMVGSIFSVGLFFFFFLKGTGPILCSKDLNKELCNCGLLFSALWVGLPRPVFTGESSMSQHQTTDEGVNEQISKEAIWVFREDRDSALLCPRAACTTYSQHCRSQTSITMQGAQGSPPDH